MPSRPLILCVGDIDVDLVIGVSHVPGPDEKVNGRRLSLAPGGMMANAAVALARLGSRARLMAAVGADHDGDFAVSAVAAEGVDVRYVTRKPAASTFMCVVMVGPAGEKSLVRVASDAYLPEPADITPMALEGVGHVHLTLGSPGLARRQCRPRRPVGSRSRSTLRRPICRPTRRCSPLSLRGRISCS